MVIVLEVPLASIALILSLVSWKTLRTIKHVGVGKSFWVPILFSGIFFLFGSIMAILNDLGLSFVYAGEVSAASKLIALCTLLSGVYTYSRKITENLGMKFTLPTGVAASDSSDEKTEISGSFSEEVSERRPAKELECKYKFGYLQTMPRSAAIPDECLNCHQIIECKHSNLKKLRSRPATPSPNEAFDVVISDSDLKQRTTNER